MLRNTLFAALLTLGMSLSVQAIPTPDLPTPATSMGSLTATSPMGSTENPHKGIDAANPIPHDIAAFVPIKKDVNQCMACHQLAKDESAPRGFIPKSHMTGSDLDNRRFVCTTCHMPVQSPEK